MIERIKAAEYVKPSKYLKIEKGDTRVVLLSDIYLYKKHQIRIGGKMISHIDDGEKEMPEVFTKPNRQTGELPKYETKQKWAWVAYSLTTKRFGILEAGVMLGDQLANLCKDTPEYKTLEITITRTGDKLSTKYDAKFSGKVDMGEDGKPVWWDEDKFKQAKTDLEG